MYKKVIHFAALLCPTRIWPTSSRISLPLLTIMSPESKQFTTYYRCSVLLWRCSELQYYSSIIMLNSKWVKVPAQSRPCLLLQGHHMLLFSPPYSSLLGFSEPLNNQAPCSLRDFAHLDSQVK